MVALGCRAARDSAWDLCSPGLQHPKLEVRNRMREPLQFIAVYSCLGGFPHLHVRLGLPDELMEVGSGADLDPIDIRWYHSCACTREAHSFVDSFRSNPVFIILRGRGLASLRTYEVISLFRCCIITRRHWGVEVKQLGLEPICLCSNPRLLDIGHVT